GVDDRPGGLDAVLAGEERLVAFQSVAEKPLVGLVFARLLVAQVELALTADELLTWLLDSGSERDGGLGREPEAQVVRRAGARPGIAEHPLRRRLELDEHLGHRPGQALARAEIPWHPTPAPVVDVKAHGRVGRDLRVRRD